jgi:acetoin utilization protein AcuB
MLVRYWMIREVVTVDVNDPIKKALHRLKKHRARFLPVLENRKLVGVLSEKDLKKALGLDFPLRHLEEWMAGDSPLKVGDIMNDHPITVGPDYTMEEVVKVLLESKVPGAPVTDQAGEVIGIITRADLYRALIAMCGFMEKGIQFAFQLEDRPGSLREVTDIIRRHGGRIASILTSFDTAPAGYRHAYVRAFGVEADQMAELRKALSLKAKVISCLDTKA